MVGERELAVRRATVADAPRISELIRPYADRNLMLHRPVPALYEQIRDFQVIEEGGQLLACVALHVFDATLAEIKSLAVAPGLTGRGVGRVMVARATDDAVALGVDRIFALVMRVGWFEQQGFRVVPKEELPQKVWGECIFCPKFHRCDEVAVVRDLVIGGTGDCLRDGKAGREASGRAERIPR